MSFPIFAQDSDNAKGLSAALQKLNSMREGVFDLLPNLLIAIVLFILVSMLAYFCQSLIVRWTDDRKSENVGLVIGRLTKWVLLFLGLMIGVSIVSPSVGASDIFSMLGIGTVAIGFAFKDILQNFLAGLLILLREPFQEGDAVIISGHSGVVEAIETRSTILKTFDGQRVFIPNGQVFTNPVEVITAHPHRRKHCVVGIGFNDSIPQAVTEMMEAIRSVDGVLEDPPPFVRVDSLGDSSVNLKAYWWATNEDYGSTGSEVITAIKQRLDDADVEMPFPTQVVLQRAEPSSGNSKPKQTP
ncbi:MAG: mechanosensitive ion channel family protein [Planctomycetaceae bacterium]|nr:mechanosensitive ion channel family protein [Planctomycetaceae bacterium]